MTESVRATRELAHLMRTEASKWSRGFYGWHKETHDHCILFWALEMILLNLADTLEKLKEEDPELILGKDDK